MEVARSDPRKQAIVIGVRLRPDTWLTRDHDTNSPYAGIINSKDHARTVFLWLFVVVANNNKSNVGRKV